MSDFMCERPLAMTEDRLDYIEADLADGGSAYDYVHELIAEIRELWDDKAAMVPMEQA